MLRRPLLRHTWNLPKPLDHRESCVHYARNVTFGEDQWRIRRLDAPYIVSSLACLAVNLLRFAAVSFIPTGLRHRASLAEEVIRFLGLRL